MADKKQSWECLKRRLVCDFSRPLCKKCCARGVSCPGYDHKPLKWMAPGQTRSKQRGVRSPQTIAPSIDVCSEVTEISH
ncbi:Uncharacterized protein TPAR_04869 [Tolypocladium paradoxum]|uniref:Zn(2)-C6 fungal-type domain-containing protein n=1 Tax=Tolypocladium paradoxum TaxID=94208 RepID=A0A2S4KXP8_9HYPO|nr:Uncharacterized protein TPAR_04869 [Tolypocladium paradoxum]